MQIRPFKVLGIGAAFSPNLKANLHESSRLALFFKAKLVLIHVGEQSQEKELKITSILQPFIEQGLPYEIVFMQGEPVDAILLASVEKNIDLLILGAIQREKLLKYYIGSIARKITRQANCSILLLINPSEVRVPCEHIVVNGLENPKTKQTVASAFYVAHVLGAKKITIVEEISQHEVSIAVDDDRSLRKANVLKERIRSREKQRVNKLIAELPKEQTEEINIQSQPIFGKSGYSIGHYAQISRADLLIMNAPDKMNLWDRIFPHDIEYILSELPTDVLIIR